MTDRSWIALLIVLTLLSLIFSASIIFTGGYNSYIMRMVSRYSPPTSQIKVIRKQFAIEKLQVPEEKLKELDVIASSRYHIKVEESNVNNVGVKDPFKGR